MLPGLAGISGMGGFKAAVAAYQGGASSSTAGTTHTFLTQPLGTAASDRIIIVSVFGNAAAAAGTISSATIGGVSASIIEQATDGGLTGGLIAAAVPTGTTETIAVTFSTSQSEVGIGIWSATGQVSATPVASGSNTDLSQITLNAEPGGFVIAACGNGGDISEETVTWTGATEDFDMAFGERDAHSGARQVALSSSISVQPTLGGSATDTVLVAATF